MNKDMRNEEFDLMDEDFEVMNPDGKPKGIVVGKKLLYDASKDSSGVILIKSLLVILLCVGGFVLPIVLDMEQGSMVLCIFAAIGLSLAIFKNT